MKRFYERWCSSNPFIPAALLSLLLVIGVAIANDFYDHGSFPATGAAATSAAMRAELDLIEAGFDKLPALTGNGNEVVTINSGGTGMTSSATPAMNGVTFPASQVNSANANTLDDYEEGSWTPVLTFQTPGDLAVTYSFQLGTYTKIGRMFTLHYQIVTSAFTHTTAAGNLLITGAPFQSNVNQCMGSVGFTGITKANYTNYNTALLAGAAKEIKLYASGSGQVFGVVQATDMPTGGSVTLLGSVSCETS